MCINTWCKKHNIGATKLRALLLLAYQSAPTKQALDKIIKLEKTPSLELAIMLNEISHGEVPLDAWMIINPKHIIRPERRDPESEKGDPERGRRRKDTEVSMDDFIEALNR